MKTKRLDVVEAAGVETGTNSASKGLNDLAMFTSIRLGGSCGLQPLNGPSLFSPALRVGGSTRLWFWMSWVQIPKPLSALHLRFSTASCCRRELQEEFARDPGKIRRWPAQKCQRQVVRE